MSVMMRQCAGGQELTSVSPAGTFSINPIIIPVCLLVIMSAPHSEWHMHACHVEDCTALSDVYHYREYYGDSANRQCQLCHPLCEGGCTGEVWVLYLCPLCSALFHSGLFVQGPSNCTMCTSSSLYVNRSNVLDTARTHLYVPTSERLSWANV